MLLRAGCLYKARSGLRVFIIDEVAHKGACFWGAVINGDQYVRSVMYFKDGTCGADSDTIVSEWI